ncbi:hypothetical protein ACFZB4_18425 [Streptomyces pseudovenezuelae]|uniref:hypothetical protein n=1 Tax=Streptomyces pseudovenezuelae TaxID=67350 RepID=UPI0036EE50DC
MRRGTHALWALYALLALGLLAAAGTAARNHQLPGAAFFTAAAVGCALAIVHTSWLIEEVGHVRDRLHAATGRPRLTTRQDVEVRKILAADCCDTWWATAGAEHDPEHCTRKDQTT